MDVLISITGTQLVDGERDTIELTTTGGMDPAEDGWRLTYEESAATGMEGVTTAILIKPDEVLLERTGKMNSLLVLQKGRRHQCSYDTPYGTFLLGVYTSELSSTLSRSGGELRFSYTLDMSAGLMSSHDVHISVKGVQ